VTSLAGSSCVAFSLCRYQSPVRRGFAEDACSVSFLSLLFFTYLELPLGGGPFCSYVCPRPFHLYMRESSTSFPLNYPLISQGIPRLVRCLRFWSDPKIYFPQRCFTLLCIFSSGPFSPFPLSFAGVFARFSAFPIFFRS